MNIKDTLQRLIEENDRKTARLSPLVRSVARQHYYAGVSDCMREMTAAALAAEPSSSAEAPAPGADEESE